MSSNAIYQASKLTICLFLLSILFSNCSLNGDVFGSPSDGNGKKCLAPSDAQDVRTITTNAFHAIIVGDDWGRSANITVEKGDTYQVTLVGSENVLSASLVTVNNGVLTLSLGECFVTTVNLKVKITTPNIDELTNRAWNASIVMKGFSGQSLNIESSSFSALDLDIQYQSVKILCSSSGHITCTGKADNLEATFYDFSYLKGFGFEVKNADISSSVQNDLEVTVTDALKARILSAGNIKYKGHPAITADISGTGRMIDAN